MGGLAKRVPTTRRSLGFSIIELKNLGICSENTSITSRGFCSAHQTQSQHRILVALHNSIDQSCTVRPKGSKERGIKGNEQGRIPYHHTRTELHTFRQDMQSLRKRGRKGDGRGQTISGHRYRL